MQHETPHDGICVHIHYFEMDNGLFGAARGPSGETRSYRCDAPATTVFADALGDRPLCQAHHDEWSAEITA